MRNTTYDSSRTKGADRVSAIDWTKHDEFPESTCYCRCGAVFRSHSKMVFDGVPKTITRRPCPACKRDDDCRRISADPEKFTLEPPK